MTTKTRRFELPPFAYAGLSAVTLAIALAAAALTANLFIIGLHHTDKDPQIMQSLAMLGILFTVAELVCFYAATALPKQFWKARTAMVVLGAALIVFEIGTVTITQLAFAKSAEIDSTATTTQATELRASIAQQRETIATMRNAAAEQAKSKFKESRAQAQTQLDKAIELENGLAAKQEQLTALDRAQTPTLSSILKTEDALLYFILMRATLLAGIVAAMTAASGSLFRHFMNLRALRAENPGVPLSELMEPVATVEPEAAPSAPVDVPPTLEDSLEPLMELIRSGELKPTIRELVTRGLTDGQARDALNAMANRDFLLRVGNGYVMRRSAVERQPIQRLVRATVEEVPQEPTPEPIVEATGTEPAEPPAPEQPQQTEEERRAAEWHRQHGTVNTAFGTVRPEPDIVSEPTVAA